MLTSKIRPGLSLAYCLVTNNNTLNKDTIALEIKRDAVFSNTETMGARRQINQWLSADKRVFQSCIISQFFVNAFLDFAGEAFKVAFASRRKLNSIHYASPNSCLTFSNGINPFFLWDKITSIEPLLPEQIYNIEEEDAHDFISNGISAHNTMIGPHVHKESLRLC